MVLATSTHHLAEEPLDEAVRCNRACDGNDPRSEGFHRVEDRGEEVGPEGRNQIRETLRAKNDTAHGGSWKEVEYVHFRVEQPETQ